MDGFHWILPGLRYSNLYDQHTLISEVCTMGRLVKNVWFLNCHQGGTSNNVMKQEVMSGSAF